MIYFQRGKETPTVVEVVVDTGLGAVGYKTPFFKFAWDAGTEWAAILLRERLVDKWLTYLQGIREKCYLQGWADAKAKRRKLYP